MIAIFICAFVYYISKEMEEASWENSYPRSWGNWWNNDTSWVNKHRWGKKIAKSIGAPSLSKHLTILFQTALVFVTDASHFFQAVRVAVLVVLVAHIASLEASIVFFLGYTLGGMIKEALRSIGINIIK
jgi:hypothetical protein